MGIDLGSRWLAASDDDHVQAREIEPCWGDPQWDHARLMRLVGRKSKLNLHRAEDLAYCQKRLEELFRLTNARKVLPREVLQITPGGGLEWQYE